MLASSETSISSRFFKSRIFLTCLTLVPIIAAGCDMGTYEERLNSNTSNQVGQPETQGSDGSAP